MDKISKPKHFHIYQMEIYIIDRLPIQEKIEKIQAKHWTKQQIFDLAYQHSSGLDSENNPSFNLTSVKTRLTNIGLDSEVTFPSITQHDEYYDYSQPGLWVVFANKKVGGGFLNTGWVQEEIIAAEFYQMGYGITKYRTKQMNFNEVYLWFNLIRNSVANPDKYGGRHIRNESKTNSFDPNNYLSHAHSHIRSNFVSMDAPYRKSKSSPYTLTELQHLMFKSLTGFGSGVKYGLNQIHTGNWGGGAFNNKSTVVLLIQGIAAWLSGVKDFHFWGLKDISDPQFNQIWNVFLSIDNHTPEQVFNHVASGLGIEFSLRQVLNL